jgi:hypothetical protein
MGVWQEKLKARETALSDVLPNLAGGEEHGGKGDLYCDGSCNGHAIHRLLTTPAPGIQYLYLYRHHLSNHHVWRARPVL